MKKLLYIPMFILSAPFLIFIGLWKGMMFFAAKIDTDFTDK